MPANVIQFRAENFARDSDQLVSQTELAELLEDQQSAWLSFCRAHEAATRIRDRLNAGARMEPGRIAFDTELCKAFPLAAVTSG
jgi:hypothetical protein